MGQQFQIRVNGPFDLAHADGTRIHLSGRKDCGLLALLAMSPNHMQPRKWLQDMLWTDRGESQGAASLRQTLSRVRTALGREADAIGADRVNVWLNPEVVSVEGPCPGRTDALLQGMDVRAEGFDAWLRDLRQRHDTAPAAPTARAPAALPAAAPATSCAAAPTNVRRILFDVEAGANGDAGAIALAHTVRDSLVEQALLLGLDAVRPRPGCPQATPTGTDIVVSTRVLTLARGGTTVLSANATDAFGRVLWQFRRALDAESWMTLRAAEYELGQQFQDFLLDTHCAVAAPDDARAHGCTALLGIMAPGTVDLTDAELSALQAVRAAPNGVYEAVLGMVRLLLYGERVVTGAADADELMDPFRRALGRSPANGVVCALAGHAHNYLTGEFSRGLELTSQAVRLAPNASLCWVFHALSLAYAGRSGPAIAAFNKLDRTCAASKLHPLAQSIGAYVHLMAGNVAASRLYAARSLDRLPDFRPTTVDMMVACAEMGDKKAGRHALQALVRRQPDLSLDLLGSPQYPIVVPGHRERVFASAKFLGLR
ncbi:MAG: hypothetical protein AAF318_12360 [Pseudomonadota bacterium]